MGGPCVSATVSPENGQILQRLSSDCKRPADLAEGQTLERQQVLGGAQGSSPSWLPHHQGLHWQTLKMLIRTLRSGGQQKVYTV